MKFVLFNYLHGSSASKKIIILGFPESFYS
jgi:hypothetical protein